MRRQGVFSHLQPATCSCWVVACNLQRVQLRQFGLFACSGCLSPSSFQDAGSQIADELFFDPAESTWLIEARFVRLYRHRSGGGHGSLVPEPRIAGANKLYLLLQMSQQPVTRQWELSQCPVLLALLQWRQDCASTMYACQTEHNVTTQSLIVCQCSYTTSPLSLTRTLTPTHHTHPPHPPTHPPTSLSVPPPLQQPLGRPNINPF